MERKGEARDDDVLFLPNLVFNENDSSNESRNDIMITIGYETSHFSSTTVTEHTVITVIYIQYSYYEYNVL